MEILAWFAGNFVFFLQLFDSWAKAGISLFLSVYAMMGFLHIFLGKQVGYFQKGLDLSLRSILSTCLCMMLVTDSPGHPSWAEDGDSRDTIDHSPWSLGMKRD